MGLQSSIWSNRAKTVWLLMMFPVVLFVVIFLVFGIAYITNSSEPLTVDNLQKMAEEIFAMASGSLILISPFIFIWFIISFLLHRRMIFKFTGARPITRKEYPEIYNIVENLCISRGLPMVKIGIIEDDSMNAFATGWNPKNAWIVFSRGILTKCTKEEIEAVAAHELTHILNKDTLLMICIVVVIGIFTTLGEILVRSSRYGSSNEKDEGKSRLFLILLGISFLLVGYLFFPLIRLAISRKREYLADAGAVQLTKNKEAMISALRKIATDARIEAIQKRTIAAMCIDDPFIEGPHGGEDFKQSRREELRSTHPSIANRIKVLQTY